jgi:hypothetical protein
VMTSLGRSNRAATYPCVNRLIGESTCNTGGGDR